MSSGSGRVMLTDQDEQLLAHLGRYRLTLADVANEQFFPERTTTQAWGRMHKLTKAGFLSTYALPTGRGNYWTLGSVGVKHVAAPRAWSEHLNAQAFKRWVTTLLLCYGGETKYERLKPFELFGVLKSNAVDALDDDEVCSAKMSEARDYFIDRSNEDLHRIAVVRPAYEQDPFAVARKCRAEFTRHARFAPFHSLMLSGRFLVAVVACSREQRQQLERSLLKHFEAMESEGGIQPKFHVFVRRRLAQFMTPARQS